MINPTKCVGQFLASYYQGKPEESLALVESLDTAFPGELGAALIRTATQSEAASPLFYQRLYNAWSNAGTPAMKPNPVERRLLLLSDLTMDQISEPLQLFAAARGVRLEVALSEFDSVEQEILNPDSFIYDAEFELVALLLSNDWLSRYLGEDCLVCRKRLQGCQAMIEELVEALEARSSARILLCTWPQPAYPGPSGYVRTEERVGRRLALLELNAWVGARAGSRLSAVDIETPIHLAGGVSAIGRRSYSLARMPFEPAGTLAVARELAGAIASCSGQTHRALVTDWDNTLWGGEIAELGPFGVVCGHDSGEPNAYRQLQSHILGLGAAGIMLAGVTRNDPSVADLIDQNPDIALDGESFATIRAEFQPKSLSMDEVSSDLGFGPEYMVFLDDSLFELGEVLLAHPYIDVVHAGPHPENTLARLVSNRLFNQVSVSQEDLLRTDAARSLKRQRERSCSFASHDEFLDSIEIKLGVSEYCERNRQRILQLIHKTNQFNLTTKRHTQAQLGELIEQGARVWAFAYEDSFGPQGIISAVVLVPHASDASDVPDREGFAIDTWVMSCRVLNRTVEQAVFCWLDQELDHPTLIGEYRPTPKNGLVSRFYDNLGFEPYRDERGGQGSLWIHEGAANGTLPDHRVTKFIVE